MKKKSILLLTLLSAIVVSGCAGVAIQERQERGLFQRGSDNSLEPGTSFEVSETSRFGDFIWPIKRGQITSLFGSRRRDFHEGIDIRANRGTPVYAAKAGRVIYASRKIRGYGNMIVLRHSDGTSSVYAHNKKNLVRRGQTVDQGQMIAEVGATGKATGPHLHFEIRKGEIAQDPLIYLPQVRIAKNSTGLSEKNLSETRKPAAID